MLTVVCGTVSPSSTTPSEICDIQILCPVLRSVTVTVAWGWGGRHNVIIIIVLLILDTRLLPNLSDQARLLSTLHSHGAYYVKRAGPNEMEWNGTGRNFVKQLTGCHLKFHFPFIIIIYVAESFNAHTYTPTPTYRYTTYGYLECPIPSMRVEFEDIIIIPSQPITPTLLSLSCGGGDEGGWHAHAQH